MCNQRKRKPLNDLKKNEGNGNVNQFLYTQEKARACGKI